MTVEGKEYNGLKIILPAGLDISDSTLRKFLTDYEGKIVIGGYDRISQTNSTTEENPVSQQYYRSTLADVTNGAANTYYYYVNMNGYRKAGFQFELNGGTALNTMVITLEGTLQDDGTAQDSCTYQDITSDTFGAVSLSCAGGATLSEMWIDNAEKLACFHYVRIKLVFVDTGDADADWTIYHKRLY